MGQIPKGAIGDLQVVLKNAKRYNWFSEMFLELTLSLLMNECIRPLLGQQGAVICILGSESLLHGPCWPHRELS